MGILTTRGRLAVVAGLLAVLALAFACHARAATFSGKFELVPLFADCKDKAGKAVAKTRCPVLRNGHQYYAARNPVSLKTDAGETVTFFAGQRTDLASIPQPVWWVLPPDGPWAEVALPHDACYRTKGTFQWYAHLGRTRAKPYTRAECDEILREGMVALQVPTWKRVVIFEAVRGFGGSGWGH
jgi:hypothetical protein